MKVQNVRKAVMHLKSVIYSSNTLNLNHCANASGINTTRLWRILNGKIDSLTIAEIEKLYACGLLKEENKQ